MRVDYIDHMGNDLSVVNAARVSFDKESDWAKMLKLRLDPHAQQETREVAEQCENLINPLFPVSLTALLESGVE